MLTVEEARRQMLAHARRLEPDHVDIRAALGRVLAEPIVSRRVIPPWPSSSMDGYAVRAADTTPAPAVLAFSLAAHLTFVTTRALVGLAFLPRAGVDLLAPRRA